jgi:divinyl chlorophyllide a 8-vinyl-reductase
MLFRAIGKEPSYTNIPVWIFDLSINTLQWLADVLKNEQLENAAELGRIGKYYAVEDMVEVDNRYGTITLQEYFNRIAVEGQEYDPFTSMTGILKLFGNSGDKNDEGIQQQQLSIARID